jgi:hypothetical protein
VQTGKLLGSGSQSRQSTTNAGPVNWLGDFLASRWTWSILREMAKKVAKREEGEGQEGELKLVNEFY